MAYCAIHKCRLTTMPPEHCREVCLLCLTVQRDDLLAACEGLLKHAPLDTNRLHAFGEDAQLARAAIANAKKEA